MLLRLALALCALTTAAMTMADVATITSEAEPPSREVWRLEEAWRVGADENDVLLGQVAVIRSGPDGEIFALDSQLAQVVVFGPDGGYRRTLGREGEGPGEFRQPLNLFFTDDGRLAVQQAFPGRIVYLDPADGTPRGSWQREQGEQGGGFAVLNFARERGGTFAVAGTDAAFDMDAREMRDTSFLALIDADGTEASRLCELATSRALTGFTIDELNEFDPSDRDHWDVAPDGRLYVVPRYDAYQVDIYGPDTVHQASLVREHDARVKTEAEKEDQRNSMSMNINGMEPEITWKLQDTAQAIDAIQILDDGTLWVRDSHGRTEWPDEGRMTFGVFDAAGHLQREVTLDAPLPGEGNRLVLLDDGRVMMVKGLDSISISISAGDGGDEVNPVDNLGDELLELIMFEIAR